MKKTVSPLQQAVLQVPLLLLLSMLIALAVNHWRQTPLSLVGDYSVTVRFADEDGQSAIVSLAEAKQLYDEHAVTFLDARPAAQYRSGHISGALNLPWQDVTQAFTKIAVQLDEEDTIITYCDGESCELSHDLALFLNDFGFVDVRVLVNGWTVWRDAGLPVAKTGETNGQ